MIFLNKNNQHILKKIPKKIHYVWVGEEKISENTVKKNIKSWENKNPNYEIILWNENNIDFKNEYIKNAYKNKKWANVSNLVRLLAIYKYGGFYLDTDVKLLKSLENLRNNKIFFGFQLLEHQTDWVNNAIFGAIPKHWFIAKAIEYLEFNFNGTEPANYSAPRMITSLLKNEGLKTYSKKGVLIKDVFIYPVDYFYPFSWEESFSNKRIKKNTYAIHFWEKKW